MSASGSPGGAQVQPVCIADYQRLASTILSEPVLAYLDGGAADEVTTRWNRSAFDRIGLVPRVLAGGLGNTTKRALLGTTLDHPIIVAPVAFQKLAHPDGERATALAATAQDALMVLSCQATTSLEEAHEAGATCRWFQLYFQSSRSSTEKLVRRAEDAGYEALVVTVDAPVNGARNRESRTGFSFPPGMMPVNLIGLDPEPNIQLSDGASVVFDHFMKLAPTWHDVAWLRSLTKLPIILKGILAADDAEKAIGFGVDGLVVSNHGGRTLDTAIATIDALPKIAETVGGRIPLLLDGGIRRGTDVLKALALGASAVLIGRPIVYGLAVNGALGVSHVIRLLRDEFEIAMALTGCRSLDDIGPHLCST